MTSISMGFFPEPMTIAVTALLPSRQQARDVTASVKFRQICSSIAEIGVIEPLSVTLSDKLNHYLIRDGHLRWLALQQLNLLDAPCLQMRDDEGFTYNSRLNRLSSVQEHLMIRRAIDRGVAPSRIAAVLGLQVGQIHKKATLLTGIADEAAALLNDHHFSVHVAATLRNMQAERQIECAELMVAANKVTVPYAEALLAATPESLLLKKRHPSTRSIITVPQKEKMQHEMKNLRAQYTSALETYGQEVLNVVVMRRYVDRLMSNVRVLRYLERYHADMCAGLKDCLVQHLPPEPPSD